MSQRPSARLLALLCLSLFAIALGGCSGLGDTEPQPPTGDEAADRLSAVGPFNATVVTEVELENETLVQRVNRTLDPATGRFYQVFETNGSRQISVSNGTTTWSYRPAVNEVTVTDFRSMNGTNRSAQVRQLFDSLDTDETSKQAIPVIRVFPAAPSPAPAAGGSSDSTTAVGLFGSQANVTYEGTETVLDREAYVVQIRSSDDPNRPSRQTLYYDTEHLVVLRANYTFSFTGQDGEESTVSGESRLTNVEFDADVDDDIFEFEIPENASVSRPGETFQEFDEYDELTAASDTRVPEPEVPGSYEFDSGTLANGTVSLVYSNGTSEIILGKGTVSEPRADGETVRSQGRTYTYSGQFGVTTLQWQCGETTYSITSQADLDRTTLLEVGDSVQCPAD